MPLELNRLYHQYIGSAPLNIGTTTRGLTVFGIGDKLQSIILTRGLAYLNLETTGNIATSLIEFSGIENVKLNIAVISKTGVSQFSFIADANLPNVINKRNCQLTGNNTAINKALISNHQTINNQLLIKQFNNQPSTSQSINQINCNLFLPPSKLNYRPDIFSPNSLTTNYNLTTLSIFAQRLIERKCTITPNNQLNLTRANIITPNSLSAYQWVKVLVNNQNRSQTKFDSLTGNSRLIQEQHCYFFQGHNDISSNRRKLYPQPIKYIQPCGRTGAKLTINKPIKIGNSLNLTCYKPYPRIQLREVYYVKNEISLIRISDNTEIPVTNLSVPMDADSWSGDFSASIPLKAGLDLVKNQNPEDIMVVESSINSYQWRWIVEKWSWSRKFGDDSINISGRGIISLMSDRYLLARNYTEPNNQTIAQLAENELIDGWTINWQAADWLVPGEGYSYTGRAPIESIARLVNVAGAVIIPHPTNTSITIKPYYPTLPWNYYNELIVPDLTIPSDALINQSREFNGTTEINGVYVYGVGSDGILAFVKLNGTNGNKLLLNQQGNSLITHVDGARALGSYLLAENYQQPAIKSFSIPLGGDYPLIGITNLISITENGEDVRGIVSNINISASNNSVIQNITIGKNSTNNWKRFKELLPSSPLLIATILNSDNETNTSNVLPIGGGIIKVRGNGITGHKVYIQNGQIQEEAPDFINNYEIEV